MKSPPITSKLHPIDFSSFRRIIAHPQSYTLKVHPAHCSTPAILEKPTTHRTSFVTVASNTLASVLHNLYSINQIREVAVKLYIHRNGENSDFRILGEDRISVMNRPVTAMRTPARVNISSRDHEEGDSSRARGCVVLVGGIVAGAAWIAWMKEIKKRLKAEKLIDILEDFFLMPQGWCTWA